MDESLPLGPDELDLGELLLEDGEERLSKEEASQRYLDEERASQVDAANSQEIAKKTLDLARKRGISVGEGDSLIDVLSRLQIKYDVYEDICLAVSEVLSFLYRCDLDYRSRSE